MSELQQQEGNKNSINGGNIVSTHIYEKYKPWETFGGKRVLNIGCGFAKFDSPNVVNLDAFDNCRPDVVHDLNKTPFPFRDQSFDLILANHILEHLPNWWECFNECARILKEGGKMEIWVPGSGTDAVFGYRDHVQEINACGFFGVLGTYRSGGNAWADHNSRCWANRMVFHNRKTKMIDRAWINWAPRFMKKWMAEHLRNVVIEEGFIFRRATEAEFQAEERRSEQRRNDNRAIPMLSLSEAGVREGHRSREGM